MLYSRIGNRILFRLILALWLLWPIIRPFSSFMTR